MRTTSTGMRCQTPDCQRIDTHNEINEAGWAKWMCPEHHWTPAVRSLVCYPLALDGIVVETGWTLGARP